MRVIYDTDKVECICAKICLALCFIERWFNFPGDAQSYNKTVTSSVARGARGGGRPPQSSPEMSFVILPNPLRNWRGGDRLHFSPTLVAA